ncbi:MAG: COX15/CtaA family protein [bacterium]|nr:COX15/CtaA family protein [bacterium]
MKVFRRLALISTIGTYLVIFIGGLVRVSGAGLGCPDWPKCFGRWFPPTSIDQVPGYFDASRFNIVLAWIEYINRLCGMTLGILILITAILAVKHCRHNFKVMVGALSSAILVTLVGFQGAFVISSELEPFAVSIHMLLALLLASAMIYTTQHAYYEEDKRTEEKTVYPSRTQKFIFMIWIITGIQVVLGTQMRSKLEILAQQFPLKTDLEWLDQLGAFSHSHMGLGLIMLLLTILAGRRILVGTKSLPALARNATIAMLVLISIQILLGFVFMLIGMPELARVFHLWIASMFFGATLIIYNSARRARSHS